MTSDPYEIERNLKSARSHYFYTAYALYTIFLTSLIFLVLAISIRLPLVAIVVISITTGIATGYIAARFEVVGKFITWIGDLTRHM